MKITITCNICQSQLVFAENPNFTKQDVDLYQRTISCDTDGLSDISIVLTDDEDNIISQVNTNTLININLEEENNEE